MPLDGLWLRAPYLHNGSVPTLRALLFPETAGAVLSRLRRVRLGQRRLRHQRTRRGARRRALRHHGQGNSNGGHLYGQELPADQREDLLEYLKTL